MPVFRSSSWAYLPKALATTYKRPRHAIYTLLELRHLWFQTNYIHSSKSSYTYFASPDHTPSFRLFQRLLNDPWPSHNIGRDPYKFITQDDTKGRQWQWYGLLCTGQWWEPRSLRNYLWCNHFSFPLRRIEAHTTASTTPLALISTHPPLS